MNLWNTVRLSEVIELQRGHDLPVQARQPGVVPVLGSNGIVGFHDDAPYTGPGVTIGRSGVIGGATYTLGPYWPLNTCLFVKDFKGNDSRWVYYWLKSTDFSSMDSGSAQPSLNRNYIAGLPVSLPPVPEQKAIADILGALDDKIDNNNQLALTTEHLGAAKFKLTGLDTEPTDAGVLLDELFALNPRRVLESETPTVIDMQALPTTTPLVGSWNTGVRKGGARFANGDTLIARITPCLENRKTAFIDFLGEGEVGIGSTEFIVMRSKNNLPLGLSYFMATSARFRDFAIQNLVGTSGRQRVSAADLARHTLSPIDPSELQSFGEWADANLSLLGAIRNENQVLKTTRDTLLPRLMSGKLRVKDAEALVESVV